MKTNYNIINQKRFTNVAVVKYKSHGKRFEIACFKNKVLNWREGVEKDINEVLQTTSIFSNCQRGVMASKADVEKAFGSKSEEEICRLILEKGDLQVSDKEREVHLEALFRDVATIVADKCVSPSTGLPLTVTMVESLMREAHISIRPGVPSKKQALKAIEILAALDGGQHIARAEMRLRISCIFDKQKEVRELVHSVVSDKRNVEEIGSDFNAGSASGSRPVESGSFIPENVKNNGKMVTFAFDCAPSHYRTLDKFCQDFGHTLQVLDKAVRATGEADKPWQIAQSQVYNWEVDPKQKGGGGYAVRTEVVAPAASSKPGGPKCSTCLFQSQSRDEYREHCKSPWHNYNLKRKVKGMAPISFDEMKEHELDGFLAID